MATTGDEGMLSHALESFKCPRCQYKYSTVTQKPATHKEDHQKACEIRKMWELFILHQMKRIMSSGMIATVCRQSSHSHFVIIALLTWLLLTTLNEQHVKNLIKLRNLNESDENSVLITVMNAAANQWADRNSESLETAHCAACNTRKLTNSNNSVMDNLMKSVPWEIKSTLNKVYYKNLYGN